ncbi:DUF2845 domain-containing protein [Ferrimonas balearica]|uniref:DUF2845 domain-containing protein n=1 Tax=Ferrimonas balearica TaxID=44012 RepID=UPI001C9973FA|nr:DUF2845 domain-containing protein [Ferrimonas balearica]MBY5990504.1 DUF2845 domain-containing protein [Ferrimonas balearica]
MRAWIRLALVALCFAPQGVALEWSVPAFRCTSTSLVKVGDSTGALLRRCGHPALTEYLEYPEGGIALTRYHYRHQRHQSVVMEVRGGHITAIYRSRP